MTLKFFSKKTAWSRSVRNLVIDFYLLKFSWTALYLYTYLSIYVAESTTHFLCQIIQALTNHSHLCFFGQSWHLFVTCLKFTLQLKSISTDSQCRTVAANRRRDAHRTWKTVMSDCQNVSKLLRGLSWVKTKLNFPPNNCIPSSAKITMKRNSSSSRLAIDRMLLSNDVTKLRRDDQ